MTPAGNREAERPPTAQALVVVDMQNDFFVNTELARCRTDLIDACNLLARRAHAAGAPVIEVRTVHLPDRSTWALNMLEDDCGMAISGSSGAAPVEGLDIAATSTVDKTRDSAFHRTGLATHLQKLGITSFALCGVSTESCIAMTAADAYANDLKVLLVGDAVASIDPELHDHMLRNLTEQYRQPVVTAAETTFASRSS
jgi:nicotinamidase-related amidase